MEFEEILELIGGYGKYQQRNLFLFILPQIFVISWIWCKIIFMLSVPQHWCNVPELMWSNLSHSEQRAFISPSTDTRCSMHNINYSMMVEEGNFETPNGSEVMPCNAGWQYDTEYYEETVVSKVSFVYIFILDE